MVASITVALAPTATESKKLGVLAIKSGTRPLPEKAFGASQGRDRGNRQCPVEAGGVTAIERRHALEVVIGAVRIG
jgi:hypothetical protein